MDGILNINKPTGGTSYSIVALVKRLSGEKRVGHAGTLDPLASGVLPVCVGQATRVVEYLMDTSKSYTAEIEFGVTTDTYDSEGTVTSRTDVAGLTRAQVARAFDSFLGVIAQTPPRYSAVKHRGKPWYRLARAGISVSPPVRQAKVHSLDLRDWHPPVATVTVVCGKGTYIRSLAHDAGQVVGCGAMLKSLVRTRCGVFDIADAISPERLKEAFRDGYGESLLYPPDSVLVQWQAVVVGQETERLIRHGSGVELAGSAPAGRLCRAYTQCGSFLGILRFNRETNRWHPVKVFV